MIDLKPNDNAQAIGTKTGIEKIVIDKSVLNEKPVKEFIERMRARGYNVDTDGVCAIITGDNLEAYYSEMEMLATDVTPEYKEHVREMLRERYQLHLI